MAKKKGATATGRRPGWFDGATVVSVYHSGLEVWLYDDSNLAAIRAYGSVDTLGDAQFRELRAAESRFKAMLEAHRAHLGETGAAALTVPKDLGEAVVLYEGYVRTAMDS
jgi:hypothetical protein